MQSLSKPVRQWDILYEVVWLIPVTCGWVLRPFQWNYIVGAKIGSWFHSLISWPWMFTHGQSTQEMWTVCFHRRTSCFLFQCSYWQISPGSWAPLMFAGYELVRYSYMVSYSVITPYSEEMWRPTFVHDCNVGVSSTVLLMCLYF